MNIQHLFATAAIGLLVTTGACAGEKAPTALCNDGHDSHEVKAIACSLHGGIKTWYGKDGATADTTPSGATSRTTGAAKVWVNPRSMVYHCKGDRWYGHTLRGAYMTRPEATAKGYKPDGGKECM